MNRLYRWHKYIPIKFCKQICTHSFQFFISYWSLQYMLYKVEQFSRLKRL